MPLALLRPISGSASIAVATDIMKNYGVDSSIGLIASTIMGSTETTLYTIAVYSSSVRIKKTRFVLGDTSEHRARQEYPCEHHCGRVADTLLP